MVKIIFLTSNRTKMQHARYLCCDYDVQIAEKTDYGVAYNEPRTPDRDKLFMESLKDAKKRLSKRSQGKAMKSTPLMQDNSFFKDVPLKLDKLFFLEDTSVKIHALSTDSRDVPGTEIKFWMKGHNFESVDQILKGHGNDRRVTVRSDVLLYLPEYLRKDQNEDYMCFTSMKHGSITEQEYNFNTNELFPWLDNKSFNKWFIPCGSDKPISMLSEKEAAKQDFRAGAFKDMLAFLEKEQIVSKKGCKRKKAIQEVFSFFNIPAFIVCGLPCAGKTTLGEFLSTKHGYYHIEASDFMCLSYYERHGIKSTVKIPDFAEKVLKGTPSIVVDQTLAHLDTIRGTPFIVTGFRSPKELEIFTNRYRGLSNVHQVFIEAGSEIRYKRSIVRNREGDNFDLKKDFDNSDEQQLEMGLKEIKKILRAKTVINNSSFEDYFQSFLEKYPQVPSPENKLLPSTPKERPADLGDAILIALLNEDQYLTTTEIACHINRCFPNSKIITNKNNVSRYFNQKFHPYYEIHKKGHKIKYLISPTGRSRALFLLRHIFE